MLRNDQVNISSQVACRGEDKFSGVETVDAVGRCPRLLDYAAQFKCKTWQFYDGGDHLILAGEVQDYRYTENVNSLVFYNGRYAVPEIHPAAAGVGSLEAKGFVSDYLLYLLRQAHSDYSSQFFLSKAALSFLKTCFTTIPCAYPGAFLYQDKRKSYGAE